MLTYKLSNPPKDISGYALEIRPCRISLGRAFQAIGRATEKARQRNVLRRVMSHEQQTKARFPLADLTARVDG